MKVEKAIDRRIFRNLYAIRIYPKELMKEIDSTVESGEDPHLMIKTTRRESTGEPEVELVFYGRKHIEAIREDPS